MAVPLCPVEQKGKNFLLNGWLRCNLINALSLSPSEKLINKTTIKARLQLININLKRGGRYQPKPTNGTLMVGT